MSNTSTVLADLLRVVGQSQIARLTGIPQSRLSRWAAGRIPRGADDALRLQRLHMELCRDSATTPSQHPAEAPNAAA